MDSSGYNNDCVPFRQIPGPVRVGRQCSQSAGSKEARLVELLLCKIIHRRRIGIVRPACVL